MPQQVILKIIDNFITSKQLQAININIKDFIAYKVTKEQLLTLLSFLKTSEELRFTILTDLFAADFPDRHQRFELVYNLLSLKLNTRLLLKVECAEDEPVSSIAQIFSAATWYEREIYDMFGVNFIDNPDMRRILTDYGFVGHPLRKDFPVTGHLQVRYDQSLERVIYEPAELEQEFRMFDFCSPWGGADYPLPGDEKATK
ncbi:NADH-quinone oxidoreductase subunit C [Candidatus Trichorickettsia mobilis]|jgi:NADH-quinone oxidoreductase subunit C|uniref:NADH-quinone oxidoreductase subunit C n=1 Tax=Candidatus Trichorickettsia mobilis TaxID=1346319 RepID=A0ABZ0USA4_9RICK|nr:NADH-quinone oxidoreductase subunit C [Candidatus Trichorickettsia mobilis]WPY00902.1 NADH-quinone oxidoreductase subunit C [Candidatus Trichorickettsia mobilis]